MIKDTGWFRDHAEGRHLIAHDYVGDLKSNRKVRFKDAR